MGVVSRNQGNKQSGKEESKLKSIGIDQLRDLDLKGAPKYTHNVDEADDAFTFPAPPPKGRYDLKLVLAKDGVQIDESEEKDPQFIVKIEGRVVSDDKDVDNIPVFGSVSTRIGRGKHISTMAALLTKMGWGEKIREKGEVSNKQLAIWMVNALNGEKIMRGCLLDWKGGFFETDSRGEKKWRDVARTMEGFPVDSETGERKHKYTTKTRDGDEVEVNAQLYVAEWGDVNAEKVKEKIKAAEKAVEVEEEEEEKEEAKPKGKEKEKAKAAAAGKVTPLKNVKKEEEEEEEAAEDEDAEELDLEDALDE